ncbi:MAG: hypothetical protein IPM04_18870 [Saprospiraceae bacterium]|nr:hypothetical protein [Candidatus Brachybacter algidus]MBK8749806.1 hypothetical protein [Candidatus Brachybacter algidus]
MSNISWLSRDLIFLTIDIKVNKIIVRRYGKDNFVFNYLIMFSYVYQRNQKNCSVIFIRSFLKLFGLPLYGDAGKNTKPSKQQEDAGKLMAGLQL